MTIMLSDVQVAAALDLDTAIASQRAAFEANGLALGRWSALERVELDAVGDADHAGLISAGGEVTGLLGGPWAGAVGAVTDECVRVQDLEQEGGQG
jgi:hypothetical protein